MKGLLVRHICILLLLGLSLPAMADWQYSIIDSEGHQGAYVKLEFDSQGYKHIAYKDAGNDDVKYGYWDGDSWQLEVVDSAGNVGRSTCLALDDNDFPHIAYYEDTGDYAGHLKYAHWDGVSWQVETVDASEDCGQDCGIDIDSNGYPHISYLDNANVNLMYARWDGISWVLETVDNTTDYVGMYGDMVLDDDDHAHICYRNNSTGDLKYAEWDGSSWQIETVDSPGSVGAFTSIVLDDMGYQHISYYSWPDSLRYARWDGSAWQIEMVDAGGRHTSLALDSNGYPHISHNEIITVWPSTSRFKYARWDGAAWQLETLEDSGDVGVSTAIAIDGVNQPHIAYRDVIDGDLKYTWFEASSDVDQAEPATARLRLLQNVPNPFNPSTTILFELPAADLVDLLVVDVNGRVVRRLLSGQPYGPGTHHVTWDGHDDSGRSVSSGVYLYRIETPMNHEAKRMILLK